VASRDALGSCALPCRAGASGADMSAKIHDYTRRAKGHDFTITQVFDGGLKLSMCGWGNGISNGDFLILPNGNETTRYRVTSIEYYNNPPDMWKATAEFAPRSALYPVEKQEKESAI